MVTIREKLSVEIESTPETILEQVLDYLQYLKAKGSQPPDHLSKVPSKVPSTEGEPMLRGAKAKDLLKFAGTWQGEDFEECLQLVYDTRSQADDTNHCSRLIFGESNLVQQLLLHSEAGVATSVIVQGELFYMAAKSERTAANLQQIRAFLDTIDMYPINPSISEVYGSLKGKLVTIFGPKDKAQRRNFNPSSLGLGDHDLWIAATAIHYRLTVVSADSDFQRIHAAESFAIESWV